MEKIYKIYDNWREEEVFEGTFEDYKNDVLRDLNTLEEDLSEEEKQRQNFYNDKEEILEILKEAKSFFELFDSLNFKHFNIFGECVDLEIRDENDNKIWD